MPGHRIIRPTFHRARAADGQNTVLGQRPNEVVTAGAGGNVRKSHNLCQLRVSAADGDIVPLLFGADVGDI